MQMKERVEELARLRAQKDEMGGPERVARQKQKGKLDARSREKLGRGKKMLRLSVAAHGHDRRVFHEEQAIGNLAALAPLHQQRCAARQS